MDDCLAAFTTNPDNLQVMNETMINLGKSLRTFEGKDSHFGEKFFLDTIKEHLYSKISGKYPEKYQKRVHDMVVDKVNFNYNQYRLQQLISKNPELSQLVEKGDIDCN